MLLSPRNKAFIVIAVALAAAGAPSASGQATYCVNCSTELTQLLNYAQLIDSLAKQASLLETSLSQYQNMTINTTPLSSQQWGNAIGNLNAVNGLLSQATALTFTNANIGSLAAQKYSDYNSYLGQTATPQTFAQKYEQWSQDTNSSITSSLKAANLQSSSLTGDEQSTIQALQSQIGGAEGNLQALQTLAAISIENINQIRKLRQLMMTEINLHANAVQTQSDRDTAGQAAWQQFLKNPNAPTSGGTRY